MFLHQEYLDRSGIDIAWMGHPSKANLILRSSNPYRYRWVIVQFHLSGPDTHPKKYDISYLVPKKHNIKGPFVSKKQSVFWDQFDYTLSSWLHRAKRKFKILRTKEEREIALWEMFVYTSEDSFAKLSYETRKCLCNSLDPRVAIEERHKSFVAMQDALESRYSKMYMAFHEKFLNPYLESIEITNL